jgi:hypothetical protein
MYQLLSILFAMLIYRFHIINSLISLVKISLVKINPPAVEIPFLRMHRVQLPTLCYAQLGGYVFGARDK